MRKDILKTAVIAGSLTFPVQSGRARAKEAFCEVIEEGLEERRQ